MKFKMVTLDEYIRGNEPQIVHGKKVLRRHNGRMIIGCAHCKKTGLDYDGLSPCPVCRGKKRNLIKEPVVMCAFCKGTGSPSKAVVCRVCRGKGLIHIEAPIERCSECGGKGKLIGTDLMCIKCGGKGVVKAKEVS